MYESIDLDAQRKLLADSPSKTPFAHQKEAFAKLNEVFQLGKKKSASGMLVLPTGAGKTFTAVRWLCNHALSKKIKVLWLAPSYYLLDQAADTFKKDIREVPDRKTINIRCVSSSKSHAKASSIQLSDDVILMTTQTAIINLHSNAKDKFNQSITTALRKFIDDNQNSEFFVVVDEAHHTPAYGLRNLLISEQESNLGLRSLLPNLYLLGLTATPTYTDKAKKGWLSKIFTDGKQGIIYQADKEKLMMQGILARPNYTEIPTGTEVELDDALYEELTNKHKDLPEKIIETLAENQDRNNAIVNTYLADKERYGKTIIFADRWFQCVYLKDKLREKGIRVDAIYSQIDADKGSAEARNKVTQSDNQRILRQFATGLDENNNHSSLDVLINVRMLTEGADVPTVQTVFITRQTTSQILMTQMIGRALRGEKAGGSSEANIVLFFDDWKRLIDWADPAHEDGGTKETKVPKRERYPLEYIAIHLVEELSKSIENDGDYPMPPFSRIFPVGWYKTEITYAEDDESQDTMETVTEFVMVYEHTQKRFQDFIKFIDKAYLKDEWTKERLEYEWIESEIKSWIKIYFDADSDNIGEKLSSSVTKIVRHIAQNEAVPHYYPFEDRELYDVDKIAQKVIDLKLFHHARNKFLQEEFTKPNSLWQTFYKSFRNFETAVHASEMKIISDDSNIPIVDIPALKPQPVIRELTEKDKKQVKERDGNACLCCGDNRRLQVDHVFPFILGGQTSIDNSQTLCMRCNGFKGKNEIDFRTKKTPLKSPKAFDTANLNKLVSADKNIAESLTRVINFFYNCSAVYRIVHYKANSDKYLTIWEIHLFSGNDPQWLRQHEPQIFNFIHHELGCPLVTGIKIVTHNS
ncbi:DEAD/DEAH box helicase family protein [Pseudanabaena sp. UWO310]|uniref:DEAD/DEAH box helicase family protein n=1 Tax=Pseudanabaena sp. UWO310 TaxID=2480795 RepID=UPI00116138BF|nr:DEAD/DEAH box helicase family protein [Pseudanabaena sp. UWO310]TYQ24211.1 DEAD/DEAH box helicase [Pseudanabaena sp. UWO310]